MLRQAENKCRIEGILSEINIDYKSFVKDGKTVEAIGGNIKVHTEQMINGETKILEIPVQMFATKLTSKGTSNPAYESIERVMKEYSSIAAVGEEAADRIRITNAQIQMNEYYAPNSDKLTSFPRINCSFVTKVKPSEYKPVATFEAEFVVASKAYELDKEGNETGRYKINAILPQYGGKVDVIPMYSVNENVTNAISEYWNEGDTVKASGRLMFTSESKVVSTPVDFGEPEEKVVTVSVSDLLITGGSQEPLSGEYAFDTAEIQSALAERKVRLEGQKEKAASGTKSKATPAATKAGLDLGF